MPIYVRYDDAPVQDQSRLKKLKKYQILHTPPENEFDIIVNIASSIFDGAFAYINFIEEDSVFSKAKTGTFLYNGIKRKDSLCALTIQNKEVFILNDTHLTAKKYFIEAQEIQFYAACPILTFEGFPIGTVAVLDFKPHQVTDSQIAQLKMLTSLVMDKLESRIAIRNILSANDDRMQMLIHDLKNPMTAISLQAELLSKILNGDELKLKMADKISQQSKNMVNSLNTILSLARNENGLVKLQKSKVDLLFVLQELKQNFELILKDKKQALILNINQPIEVYADFERIQQVFENLISNAIKFSPAGQEIHINFQLEPDKVILSITDFGEGILPEDLDKIFIKLAKLKAVSPVVKKSNGLGLALSKALIDLHKGKIWAKSSGINKGSTFFVELPFK